jgi:hypothetical protein
MLIAVETRILDAEDDPVLAALTELMSVTTQSGLEVYLLEYADPDRECPDQE